MIDKWKLSELVGNSPYTYFAEHLEHALRERAPEYTWYVYRQGDELTWSNNLVEHKMFTVRALLRYIDGKAMSTMTVTQEYIEASPDIVGNIIDKLHTDFEELKHVS
jgi:hypothetical protein